MLDNIKLCEIAVQQSLPYEWPSSKDDHLPALALIISNILLKDCCQMSNLERLTLFINKTPSLNTLPSDYKQKLARSVYDTLSRFNGLG